MLEFQFFMIKNATKLKDLLQGIMIEGGAPVSLIRDLLHGNMKKYFCIDYIKGFLY